MPQRNIDKFRATNVRNNTTSARNNHPVIQDTKSIQHRNKAIAAGIITTICVASSAATWLLLSSSLMPAHAYETQQLDIVGVIVENSPNDDDAITPLSLSRISDEIAVSSHTRPLYGASTPSSSLSDVSLLRDSAIGMSGSIIKKYDDYVTDDERQQLTDIESDMQHVVTKSQYDALTQKFDAIVDGIADRKGEDEQKKEEQKRKEQQATADNLNARSGDGSGDASKLDGDYGDIDARMDTVTWDDDEAYIDACRKKAESVTDETGWVCVTDVSRCRSIVFHRNGDGEYQVMQTSNTQQGRLIDGVSHSFTGVFRIEFKRRALWRDGVGCNDWWSCFIPCWQSSDRNGHLYQDPSTGLYDNGQGFHAAYGDTPGYEMTGCTGLPADKAQYIYDNVPTGSTVLVF